MNTELSEIMSKPGRILNWAGKIVYSSALDSEEKEISEVMDNWAKNIGVTGCDEGHEISQLIKKTITQDTVTTPSELMSTLFDDAGSIGEFDDFVGDVAPENTIKVYEAARGGNVDRSFIEPTSLKPTWKSLQAETDLRLVDIRKGGYKTVANLMTYISEALDLQKYKIVCDLIDKAVTSGAAGYISESTAAPTEGSTDKLIVYLQDVCDGSAIQLFGINKYIYSVASFTKAQNFATDAVKNQFNTTGLIKTYGGAILTGLSGTKTVATGGVILPEKKLFGAAGKIGQMVTRGETISLQETDINNETIHIKVGGYTFGTMLTNEQHIGKIVMAS